MVTSFKSLVESITLLCDSVKENALNHYEKGIKASGRRARKLGLELSKELKKYRKHSIKFDKLPKEKK